MVQNNTIFDLTLFIHWFPIMWLCPAVDESMLGTTCTENGMGTYKVTVGKRQLQEEGGKVLVKEN